MKQQRHLLETDEVHYQAMLDELSITVADFRAKEKEKKRQQQQGHAARSAAAGGGGWQGHSSVKKRSGVVKRAMLASAEAEAAAAAAAALAGAGSDDGAAAGCEINEAAWSAEQAAAAAALAAAARARPARSAAAAAPAAAGRYAAAPSAAAPGPHPAAAAASGGTGPRGASQPQLDAATLAALPRGTSPPAQQEPQVSGSYGQQQLHRKHHSVSTLQQQQQMPQRTQQQAQQRQQQRQQMSAPDTAAVRDHTPTPAEDYVGVVQGRRGPDSAAAAAAVAAAAAEADSAYHARSVHSRYGMATASAGPSERPGPDRRAASGQRAGSTVALQPSTLGGDSLAAVATSLAAGTDPAAVAAAAAAMGLRPAHGPERVAAHSAPAAPAQRAGQQRPVSASAQAAAAQAAAAAEAAAQAASDAVTVSNTDVHSLARTAVMDAVSASLSAASVYFKLLGRAPPPHVAAAGASAAETGLTALPEDHPASNTLQAAAASAAAAAMLGMQALGSFVSSGVVLQGGAAAGCGVAPAAATGVTKPLPQQQPAAVVTDIPEPAADAVAGTYRAPELSHAPAAAGAATGVQTAAETAANVVAEAMGQVQDSSDLLGLLSAVKAFLTSRQQQQQQPDPAVHEEACPYGQYGERAARVTSQQQHQQQGQFPATVHRSYQQRWQQQQQDEAPRSALAAPARSAAADEVRPNLDLSSVSIPALLQAAAASGVDMSQLAALMATATRPKSAEPTAPAVDAAAPYNQQQHEPAALQRGAAHMQAPALAAAPAATRHQGYASGGMLGRAISQQGDARRALQVAVPDDSSGTSSQQATHASPVAAATSAGASFAELLLAAAALEPTSSARCEVGGKVNHAQHSRGQQSAAAARGAQHGSSGHAWQTGQAGGAGALAPVKTGMGTSPVTDSSSGAGPPAAAGQMAGDRSPLYRPPALNLPGAAMGHVSTVGTYKAESSPGPAGAGSVVGSPMGADWPTPRRKKAPARASRVSPVNASGTGRSPTDAASGQSSPGGGWAGMSPHAPAATDAPQGAAAMMHAPAAREGAAEGGTQRGQAPSRVGRTGFEHITGQQLQQCQQELLELQRLLGA